MALSKAEKETVKALGARPETIIVLWVARQLKVNPPTNDDVDSIGRELNQFLLDYK